MCVCCSRCSAMHILIFIASNGMRRATSTLKQQRQQTKDITKCCESTISASPFTVFFYLESIINLCMCCAAPWFGCWRVSELAADLSTSRKKDQARIFKIKRIYCFEYKLCIVLHQLSHLENALKPKGLKTFDTKIHHSCSQCVSGMIEFSN